MPETFRYLNQILSNKTKFKVISFENVVDSIEFKDSNWEIIKQNERSYYFLKILTDVQEKRLANDNKQ